jgi:hypothetical protein
VAFPQHLDPHAAGIVNVARDHPHRSPRRARNRHRPQFGRQVLEQKLRHAIAGFPGRDDGIRKIDLLSRPRRRQLHVMAGA